MNRTLCLCLGLGALALTGCASQRVSTDARVASAYGEPTVALGDLGRPVAADGPASRVTYFGAGDALGQEIFTVYLASLRQGDDYYATGSNDFPSNE